MEKIPRRAPGRIVVCASSLDSLFLSRRNAGLTRFDTAFARSLESSHQQRAQTPRVLLPSLLAEGASGNDAARQTTSARGSHVRATRTHGVRDAGRSSSIRGPERTRGATLAPRSSRRSITQRRGPEQKRGRASRRPDGTLPPTQRGAGLPGAGAVRVVDARGGRDGTYVAHQCRVLLPVGAVEGVRDVEEVVSVARERREDLGHRRERVH